ncbi:hypothetical protein FB192DRAFT_1037666 [Mucor lusitanicus]|nr:hypothetical protein FB192DRAFT_1037666 [Mucor lusitanicus]
MLRNFRKSASFKNWCVKSVKCEADGFTTILPLSIHKIADRITYETICSELISIASDPRHTAVDIQALRQSLNSIKYWEDLKLPANATKTAVMQRLLVIGQTKNGKPGQGKRDLIGIIVNKHVQIPDVKLVELYNKILYPLVNKTNAKIAKAFKQKYTPSIF